MTKDEFLEKHGNIYPQEKVLEVQTIAGISLVVLEGGNIGNRLEIEEIMRLGVSKSDKIIIKGEIKSPLLFSYKGEDLEVKEGYIVQIKIPSMLATFITPDKKEINKYLEKNIFLEI